MKIDLKDCKTSAQAMTTIGYNEPTRNLGFRVECEDLEDLKKCVEIIESYNDFDCNKINEALDKFASFKRFYNTDNLNNGSDALKFSIGRAGSPVTYITLTKFLGEPAIYSSEEMDEKKVMALTDECFTESMESLSKWAKADEFSISPEGATISCRLWWD